jgi:PAB1-binding protein PBP1
LKVTDTTCPHCYKVFSNKSNLRHHLYKCKNPIHIKNIEVSQSTIQYNENPISLQIETFGLVQNNDIRQVLKENENRLKEKEIKIKKLIKTIKKLRHHNKIITMEKYELLIEDRQTFMEAFGAAQSNASKALDTSKTATKTISRSLSALSCAN